MLGGSVILASDTSVSLSDRVLFLSINIGYLEVLCIFIDLLLIDARVGGGQLFDIVASTTICWSGKSVVTVR